MEKTNAVIVAANGRFLSSAVFIGGMFSARWVSEYPDAATYTTKEAAVVARKLHSAGVEHAVILNYGMDNESELLIAVPNHSPKMETSMNPAHVTLIRRYRRETALLRCLMRAGRTFKGNTTGAWPTLRIQALSFAYRRIINARQY